MTTCVDRADHQSVATATQIAADETRWREGMTMGRDPETPAEALEQLAGGCVWVRFAVASNPSSPGLLLARLAEDEAPLVRRRVALHPNTDPRVRRRLVADANDLVRQAAAG